MNAVDIVANAVREGASGDEVYQAIADHFDITFAEAKQLFKETLQQMLEPG